jgi:hypothetical protein
MLLKNIKVWALMALIIGASTSCKDDDDEDNTPTPSTNPFENYVVLGTSDDDNNDDDIVIYGEKEAFVGYNKIWIVERDDDGTVDDSFLDDQVTINPVMDMPMHTHSAPAEQPGTPDQNGAREAAVVFVMPTTAGDWYIDVTLTDDNESETHRVKINNVVEPQETRTKSFYTPDSARYFVSLIEPSEPKVGINDYEVVVHERKTMMSWPAVNGLTMEIEPEMPTMGHGSPDNENPVETTYGHYVGKVNFTMTGYWKVNMVVKKNGNVIKDDLFFDITF